MSWESWIIATISRTLAYGTPLLLATLGEIYAERSGVLNLGVEGMMIIGALTGFAVSYTTKSPWLGILVASAVGGFFSLIHAFASITLRANQVVSGLALTMLGLGLSGVVAVRGAPAGRFCLVEVEATDQEQDAQPPHQPSQWKITNHSIPDNSLVDEENRTVTPEGSPEFSNISTIVS